MKKVILGFAITSILCSNVSLFAQDESRGKVLYEAHCIACHGLSGKGDGLSAEALIPEPRDFTNPEVKASLTKEGVTNAIMNGKPGTQMEGWKNRLSPQDIQSLMEFILSL